MKILVVDDAMYMRRGLSEKLIKLGHNVIEAQDGEEAVIKSRSEHLDMVFIDIVMPKMDGLTAIKLLRKEFMGKIVVYTANFSKNLLIEALMAGASEYLIKPYDDFRIEAAVNNF
jgi:two-component system, chemotaxis family, chemotaxis protein CheY